MSASQISTLHCIVADTRWYRLCLQGVPLKQCAPSGYSQRVAETGSTSSEPQRQPSVCVSSLYLIPWLMVLNERHHRHQRHPPTKRPFASARRQHGDKGKRPSAQSVMHRTHPITTPQAEAGQATHSKAFCTGFTSSSARGSILAAATCSSKSDGLATPTVCGAHTREGAMVLHDVKPYHFAMVRLRPFVATRV